MSSNQGVILVTGGAGYIGSHAILALQKADYQVIILDNLTSGHKDIVENVLKTELIIGSIGDRNLLDQIFSTYPIIAVMHFAAYINVEESVSFPDKYYRNNVTDALTLLEAIKSANINKFVFSSTSAVYDEYQTKPILETAPLNPISPYAKSKLMIEQMLADFDVAYGLKSVCFRYFNAAGAEPNALIGENRKIESHLIPLLLLTALGEQNYFSVFGTDYPTPDGTCIRDFIHVMDLANAHVSGLKYLIEGGKSDIFNLGNGKGFSVKEVVEMTQKVTRKTFDIRYQERRPGDPPILVGNSEKAQRILDWSPQYPNLAQIVSHAWQWKQKSKTY
jgi:UDP-glucose 4-epimerase